MQVDLKNLPNDLRGTEPGKISHPVNPCKYLLYNDPLEGLFDLHLEADTAEQYRGFASKLLAHENDPGWGYIFRTLGLLCDLLSVKSDLGVRITAAYRENDRETMRGIALGDIPSAVAKLDAFTSAFRDQWFRENKPFGFRTLR